jgi:hypothetical protein
MAWMQMFRKLPSGKTAIVSDHRLSLDTITDRELKFQTLLRLFLAASPEMLHSTRASMQKMASATKHFAANSVVQKRREAPTANLNANKPLEPCAYAVY